MNSTKKTAVLFFLIFLTAAFLYPGKMGTLPDVMKPDNIFIFQDEFYVMEGATIYIYNLKDLSLIRKFGKTGEGPGEILATPMFPNKIFVSKDFIFAETRGKVVYFSKKGELIKEQRKVNPLVFNFQPVGKNYVAQRLVPDEKEKKVFNSIGLFDSELKLIKELYRQTWVQQQAGQKVQLNMVMDFIHYRVFGDKIFVEESEKGLHIEVFDSTGKRLRKIEKDYEKIEITGEMKDRTIERFKNDPVIKIQANQAGGWNSFKTVLDLQFPELFPPILDFGVSTDRIYIQTYKEVDKKAEFLIMDHKGKQIKKVWIPAFESTPLMARIMGAKLDLIHNNKLYYLQENEDEEEWELHVESLE